MLTIDWEKVRERAETILPDPEAVSAVEKAVKRELARMSKPEWEGIPEKQQLAVDMAHIIATQRFIDMLEWHPLQAQIFVKTGRSLYGVSAVTEMVIQTLLRMSPEEWAKIGADPKAHLVDTIDRAVERWLSDKRRRVASSQAEINQAFNPQPSQPDEPVSIWQDHLNTLRALPPIVRATVVLNKFRGYSVKKIAKRLNIAKELVERNLKWGADALSNRPDHKEDE